MTTAHSQRRPLTSLLISLVIHVAVAAVAGSWILSPPTSLPFLLESRWATSDELNSVFFEPLKEPVPSQAPEVRLVNVAEQIAAEARQSEVITSDVIAVRPTEIDMAAVLLENGNLAHYSASLSGRISGGVANGSLLTNGSGQGGSALDGDGFFGLNVLLAESIVFVVDNSKSMNHPHDSPAKTRYRRLKYELLRCLTGMQSHQLFYVIFFSNETTAMPAKSLQPAMPGVREPFLHWIARLPSAGGPTDPRAALERGLNLRPDVICFLTDGDFHLGIQKQLQRIRQNRTVIHTFAIGNADAEETLSRLAKQNRGEYRFVP